MQKRMFIMMVNVVIIMMRMVMMVNVVMIITMTMVMIMVITFLRLASEISYAFLWKKNAKL